METSLKPRCSADGSGLRVRVDLNVTGPASEHTWLQIVPNEDHQNRTRIDAIVIRHTLDGDFLEVVQGAPSFGEPPYGRDCEVLALVRVPAYAKELAASDVQ